MRRRIAVIGSGHGGLITAHGLLRAGHDVTVFSDRTAEQWLNEARPTGSAARFGMGLAFERELGLNHWDSVTPKLGGSHLTVCLTPGNQLLTMAGRFKDPGMALDLRLQCHRWINDFEARGGKLVIESVTRERLDQIAAEHELTVVATGRCDLADVFEPDPERCVYDGEPRNSAMVIAKGAPMGFPGVPYLPVRFVISVPAGEAFWIPFYHKDCGPSYNLVFGAKPGGPYDRFQAAQNGEDVLRIMKQLIKEMIAWDYAWAQQLELADPNGWIVGTVVPLVKKPVGRLPSGRIVTPLGDAAMVLDPLTGQGANNASLMAKNLVDAVNEHGDRPFDAEFMTRTFDRFYARRGHASNVFTKTLLDPITAATQELLIAQYGSDGTGESVRQKIADDFTENFNDPTLMTDIARDLRLAREFITKKTGRSWVFSAISGRAAIGVRQVRQVIGMAPKHPLAATGPRELTH